MPKLKKLTLRYIAPPIISFVTAIMVCRLASLLGAEPASYKLSLVIGFVLYTTLLTFAFNDAEEVWDLFMMRRENNTN
jgi:hypothetical protein